MIFARLEQITPNCTCNEPFLFCSKCHQYFFGHPGVFCSACGHKFNWPEEPQMISVELEKEMPYEEAIEYVYNKVFSNARECVRIDKAQATKQPEIVRCEKCRYWLPLNRFHEDYHPGRGECELNQWIRDYDWFCGDGKPMDGCAH